MKTSGILKFVRLSPKKAQKYSHLLRNLDVGEAETVLKFAKGLGAKIILKVLRQVKKSAEDLNLDSESLFVKSISINYGPTYKRQKARSRGKADVIKRKTSHIEIILAEKKSKKKMSKTRVRSLNGSKSKSNQFPH